MIACNLLLVWERLNGVIWSWSLASPFYILVSRYSWTFSKWNSTLSNDTRECCLQKMRHKQLLHIEYRSMESKCSRLTHEDAKCWNSHRNQSDHTVYTRHACRGKNYVSCEEIFSNIVNIKSIFKGPKGA